VASPVTSYWYEAGAIDPEQRDGLVTHIHDHPVASFIVSSGVTGAGQILKTTNPQLKILLRRKSLYILTRKIINKPELETEIFVDEFWRSEIGSIGELSYVDAIDLEDGKLVLTDSGDVRSLNWDALISEVNFDRFADDLDGAALL
jgi:hypothetical protein